MDTRLKNYKAREGIFAALFGLETVLVWGLFVCGSIFTAINTMTWANGYSAEEAYLYAGNITNVDRFNYIQNAVGIGGIVGILLAVIILAALIVLVGNGRRDQDGKAHLNWFDRLWSEVQITVGILAGVWAGSIVIIWEYGKATAK